MFFPKPETKHIASYRKAYEHSMAHLLGIIPTHTKILFGSSILAYGDTLGNTVTEESSPCRNLTPTSAILAGENLLKNSHHPHLILRLGHLYTTQKSLIDQIRNQKVTYSQRRQIINHIHIEDLTEAALHLSRHYGTFNIVDRNPMVLNTLYSLMSTRLGISIQTPKKWLPRYKGAKVSNAKLLSTGFIFKHPSYITQ